MKGQTTYRPLDTKPGQHQAPPRAPKHSLLNATKGDIGYPYFGGDEKTRGMYVALRKKGWTFQFIVKVDSPHGFKTEGVGATPHEALSKAIWTGPAAGAGHGHSGS